MTFLVKIAVAAVAGIIIGGVAVQGLHAQSKTPAYAVAEFEITDPAAFKEFADANFKGITAAGGRFIARRGKTAPIAGEVPKTVVLVAWDSLDQAKAYYSSSNFKSIESVRDKGAKFRAFLVEATP